MRNDEENFLCCFKNSKLCNGVNMEHSQSSKTKNTPFVELSRNNNVRASIRTKLPMPDQNELEKRFTKVLASMDLPPDKAKVLKQYDDEKKWEIICDQELVQAKDTPAHYLSKLRTYLDPKASRSSRKRKMVGGATSTQVLRDLEISLRTNHIEWVREFLNDENHGLDSLIGYLSFRLVMMRHEQLISESRNSSAEQIPPTSNGTCTGTFVTSSSNNNNNSTLNGNMTRPTLDLLDSPSIKRQSKHAAKLKMGDTKDDIHVCIMCLRAIMNNKYGFNMVIQHTEAINSIALSLMHKSQRTKALVLELLAAICLVKGGHEIILSAFDNFKEVCQEKRRFQTLMDYFVNYEIFHIEFMVACMQFVNVVVHSVEDMNFRVHLQYEFSKLGLDDYLDKLRHTESEELQVQISAYLDNIFDVAALVEDSETKTAALEKVAELEDELAQAHDRLADFERDSLTQIAAIEAALGAAKAERDEIVEIKRSVEEEVSTLKRLVNDQKRESQCRQSMLEDKIKALTEGGTSSLDSSSGSTSGIVSCSSSSSSNKCVSSSSAPPAPPLPMLVPNSSCPPPPPPPPMMRHGVPCLPRVNQARDGAMTIKPIVRTKYKLPTLTWTALKPNQVRGTIFNQLDDDKVFPVIDFATFEEKFKLSASYLDGGHTDVDGFTNFPSKKFKKFDSVSLLEHTRLRNIAISRRKIQLPIEKVILAINALDLKQISVENVEVLQRMTPNEQEVKAYRDYVNEKKDVNIFTDEDKFLLQLSRVERITNKLSIMNYIGNFVENVHTICPQVHAIISASKAVKNSEKLPKILEIILAFGNYMNSGQRGRAYGFKLHCLDSLMDTKSSDKRITLLNYIAETVRTSFPHLLNFEAELSSIEKSAAVSLESIVIDVNDLEKNMEMVKKEFEMRSKERPPGQSVTVLKEFLSMSEEHLKTLRTETKLAQDSYRECVEYFGESTIGTDTNYFFSLLLRFIRDFKKADQENEQRKKLQAAAQTKSQNTLKNDKLNPKKQEEAVINELKSKYRRGREKKLLDQDEVYNGALEDILLGLKSEPYRRADAVRRSQRRRIDNNRLSHTVEQFDC